MPCFSAEEVARHNKVSDCWLVIQNKVYDVSKYLNDHPGGVEIVSDIAGQDATEAYSDVGHSKESDQILLTLYIGDLVASGPSSSATKQTKSLEPVKAAPVAEPLKLPAVFVTPIQPAPSMIKQPVASRAPAQDDDNSLFMLGGAVAALAVGFVAYRKMVSV